MYIHKGAFDLLKLFDFKIVYDLKILALTKPHDNFFPPNIGKDKKLFNTLKYCFVLVYPLHLDIAKELQSNTADATIIVCGCSDIT
jgi:hypothetical protein